MSARRVTIVLKPAARRDLRAILLFTGEYWGTAQRDAYLETINRALSALSVNPHIGLARDEIRAGLRSIAIQQHVIYYWLNTDTVTVLRILHGKMDAAQHVDKS